MNTLTKIKLKYFLISGMIFLFILYHALKIDIKPGKIETCVKTDIASKCIQWNFLSDKLNYIIYLMYFIMILWWLFNKKYTFINKAGYFFIITFILFYTYGNIKQNRPGYWCMASAILAPILLFI